MIFPGFPGVLSFFQVFQVEWEPWLLVNTHTELGEAWLYFCHFHCLPSHPYTHLDEAWFYFCHFHCVCILTPVHSPGWGLALFLSLLLCFCLADSSSLGCPYARQRARPVPATNRDSYNEAGVAHRWLPGSCHCVRHNLLNNKQESWVNTKANVLS